MHTSWNMQSGKILQKSSENLWKLPKKITQYTPNLNLQHFWVKLYKKRQNFLIFLQPRVILNLHIFQKRKAIKKIIFMLLLFVYINPWPCSPFTFLSVRNLPTYCASESTQIFYIPSSLFFGFHFYVCGNSLGENGTKKNNK